MSKPFTPALPFPKVIRIEPASICNLRCIHCPTHQHNHSKGIMEPETFELLLHLMSYHKEDIKTVVMYHGGEPTLNPNLFKFITLLKCEGYPFVKTVTNGMYQDLKTKYKFVFSGLDEIEYSLDGYSPEENDAIRIGSKFDHVIKNIQELIKSKIDTGREHPSINISSTRFYDPNCPNAHFTATNHIKNMDLLTDFNISQFKINYAIPWPNLSLEDKFDIWHGPDADNQRYCDSITNTMTIRWNGDVVPCCYDLTNEYVAGNIFKHDLNMIWNNTKYRALRLSIQENQHISLCENCNWVNPHKYLMRK